MARGNYHRTQAQLFARLAATTSNPAIAERYSLMALEQLAKADETDSAGDRPLVQTGGNANDLDRD